MPLVCINRITCVDLLQDLRDILHLVFLKKGDNDFPSRYMHGEGIQVSLLFFRKSLKTFSYRYHQRIFYLSDCLLK